MLIYYFYLTLYFMVIIIIIVFVNKHNYNSSLNYNKVYQKVTNFTRFNNFNIESATIKINKQI